MPAHSASSRSAAPVPTFAALDGHHAADLADLLGCLREWIDAEHDRLHPLLAKHDYDIIGLRIALDRYTALLRSSHDQPPF
jgi:hypothetical protein